jgi:hypothetical protein
MFKNRRKRIGASAVCGTLIAGTIMTAQTPAHAYVDPVTMQAWVDLAYSVVRLGKSILGSSDAPALIAKLQSVQDAVINEMRTQRNMELQSNARAVFDLFRNLADNAPSDPTNAGHWTNILTLQQQTANAMYDIIQFSNDGQSAYELGPAYNSLLAAGANVLRIKRDIWPDYPSSWADYYYWLQYGMNANYKLVGSQRHQCWPGHNPGYRPRPRINSIGLTAWLNSTQPGRYQQSLLYKKKVANRTFLVQRYSCPHRINPYTAEFHCNPATRTCTAGPNGMSVTPYCTLTRNWCAAGTSPLDCATQLADPVWHADPAVQSTRASMRALQTLSGGNDYDAPNNNGYLYYGMYVDPWVDEPACGSGTPWAYAQDP